MGVPAFFKWLTIRYPQVVIDALTEDDIEVYYAEFKESQLRSAIDTQAVKQQRISQNNPQVDNLYLDMNGIIHPCCHPEGKPQPKSEVEMFNLIFEYTDKIIDIVKPKQILYLAIDGVAPRAKMNQQRSRRFRTALDAQEKADREAQIKNKWKEDGLFFKEKSEPDGFDSNVITPGTPFMHNLSKALQLYIIERLHNSEQWKNLKVIFTDAFVPGEGEHKILDFIRSQRAQSNYNPNTSHCIHGADADLIMLGLSTHEPHFYILREAINQDQYNQNEKSNKNQVDHDEQIQSKQVKSVQFQFVKISVLREYLFLEFKSVKLPFKYDFERIIDDFVFLCFFVGNDFLPHLPSLSIREGALDALIFIYKNQLPALGEYLTNGDGGLNFSQVDIFLHDLSQIEEEFFKLHKKNAERNEQFRKRDEENNKEKQEIARLNQNGPQNANKNNPQAGAVQWRNQDKLAQDSKPENPQVEQPQLTNDEIKQLNAEQYELHGKTYILNNIMNNKDLSEEQKIQEANKTLKEIVQKQIDQKQESLVKAYEDKVQLTQDGWKTRYYEEKFQVKNDQEMKELQINIRQSYIEGLAWVFAYYYKGCQSWFWYYPYHYAPFSSDLKGCDNIQIKFEMGKPALPFEQLLAVFPKQSSHALPECYRKLYEPDSEIIDFYPAEVKLDINGARYAWMGVNLLSFIDRDRLITAMNKADKNGELLTKHEKERNQPSGNIFLMFNSKTTLQASKLKQQLIEIHSKSNLSIELNKVFKAEFQSNDQIEGNIYLPQRLPKENEQGQLKLLYGQKIEKTCGLLQVNIDKSDVLFVHFDNPKFKKHVTYLLKNVEIPKREVEDFAIYHINRKQFQGETAIKIVENVLKIDASLDPVYNFRQNRNGNQFNGYRNIQNNNYGDSGLANGGFQAMPQLGQRRTYEQYQQQNYYTDQQNDNPHPQKRFHREGYYNQGNNYHGQYQRNQYQGQYPQDINYNIQRFQNNQYNQVGQQIQQNDQRYQNNRSQFQQNQSNYNSNQNNNYQQNQSQWPNNQNYRGNSQNRHNNYRGNYQNHRNNQQ